MTQDTLESIIANALSKRGGFQTPEAQKLATYIRARIDFQIEMEEETGAAAPSAPSESPTVGLSTASTPTPHTFLPPSPAITPATNASGPSLIVIPGRQDVESLSRSGKLPERTRGVVFSVSEEEAHEAELLAKKKARDAGGGEPDVEYWAMEKLINILEENTPAKLSIVPNGRQNPMELERNIQSVVVVKGVKLVYANPRILQGAIMERTEPGQSPQPVRLGLQAAVYVYQNERVIPITTLMEQVTAQAMQVFGVRQREVVSRTPIKTGSHLTIAADDPHAETDKQWYNGKLI